MQTQLAGGAESTTDDALRAVIERYDRLVVAFSGGADSALLAYVATSVLGRDRVLCATAVSPSLADEERGACAALAKAWNLRHVFVDTHELDNEAYVENTSDRCFYCKDELMDVLGGLASSEAATIVLGVNLDDLREHRPGQDAAAAKGARFPLVEAGLSKSEVRERSRMLGLETWNKPAAPCLASRIPHGTAVSAEILTRVGRAERALHQLGLSTLRVRHYDDCARIEVDADSFPRVLAQRVAIVKAVRDAGYRYATLDLEGFRSGNLSGDIAQVASGSDR